MASKSNKGPSQLQLFWEGLTPKQRQIGAVVGILSVVFLGMAVITGGEDEVVRKKNPESLKRSVLSDVNTRTIGIDALNAEVKSVRKENIELKGMVDMMETEIKDLKRRRGNDPDVTRQIAQMNAQLSAIKRKAQSLGWDVQDIKEGYIGSGETKVDAIDNETAPEKGKKKNIPLVAEKNKTPVKKAITQVEDGLNQDPNYYFRTAPVRPTGPAPLIGTPDLKNGAVEGGGLQIFTTESKALQPEDKEETAVNMPAGTILTGVLLNGLDAATGKKARKDPFPVVVRIQHDAIMPNLYSADVKECFATLAGYGDLSSERAYLRGEKFSCITNDKKTIEVDFPSYAVGEDGKAGVRGRLVSKEGSLIAKTAFAGFLGGLAEAFGSSPVPTIQTDPGSSQLFQSNYSSDAARYGAAQGASAVAERLADYYMDLADQIFPVIEVDAGRKIDIVITNGIKLKIKES